MIGHVDELPPTERYCTCCGRTLTGKIRWLELDQRTNTYHDHGDVPDDKSQGAFPFGLACATAKLAEHDGKTAEPRRRAGRGRRVDQAIARRVAAAAKR